MKTIAISGLQDEAAKSQFAAQFAELCAQRGLGTLFIDLDQQALATAQLARSLACVTSPVPASLFFNELAFQQQLVPDATSGRVVLAAADAGLGMCSETGLSALQAVNNSLQAVEQKFNLCLLCTSSSKPSLSAAAKKAVTWTLVPVFSQGSLMSLVLKSHYRVITVSRGATGSMEAMCCAALQALGLAAVVSQSSSMGVKVEEIGCVSYDQQEVYFSRVYERLGSMQGMTPHAREKVKKQLEDLLCMPSVLQQSSLTTAA